MMTGHRLWLQTVRHQGLVEEAVWETMQFMPTRFIGRQRSRSSGSFRSWWPWFRWGRWQFLTGRMKGKVVKVWRFVTSVGRIKTGLNVLIKLTCCILFGRLFMGIRKKKHLKTNKPLTGRKMCKFYSLAAVKCFRLDFSFNSWGGVSLFTSRITHVLVQKRWSNLKLNTLSLSRVMTQMAQQRMRMRFYTNSQIIPEPL